MKKILIAIVVVLASATATNAMEMRDYNVFYKLNDNVVFNSLIRYLEVDNNQADELSYVFKLTKQKLDSANLRSDVSAAEKAMFFNLGNVKFVLSEAQYRKYLIILNVSRHSNDIKLIADNK